MTPLNEQAYNYLQKLIMENHFSYQEVYSETKLSKELGISRTPMREALQCLSQDGYIDVIPSKGFRIRQLNQKDMKETIQIRCAIEGFCTHCLANDINTARGQKTIRELGNILDLQYKTIEDHPDNGNYEDFISYDHQFHLLLVKYINNDEVNHIFQRLMYLIKLTAATSLFISVLLITAVYLGAPSITAVFNSEKNPLLAQYAISGLRIYFTGFLFAGINIVGSSILSSVESAKFAFIVSIMRGFAAITFFAFLLSKIFGLTGIWSAFPAAEFLTMFVTVYGLFKIHRPA